MTRVNPKNNTNVSCNHLIVVKEFFLEMQLIDKKTPCKKDNLNLKFF